MIHGIQLKDLNGHDDSRGGFAEVFRNEWFPDYSNMMQVQINNSWSDKGVLRGLHYHRNQFDYWYVVSGRLRVGLFDLRKDSPTYLHVETVMLNELQGLFIPPMVAHGFEAVWETELVYVVNRNYDPADDMGLKWDSVGLDWGTGKPLVSERDSSNPRLEEVIRSLG